jgi:ankyrin repeat protein
MFSGSSHKYLDLRNEHPTFDLKKLKEILDYLGEAVPKDLHHSNITQNEKFWKERCKRHFHHDYCKKDISEKSVDGWYQTFQEAYDREYITITKKIRKLISLMNENNLAGLKEQAMDLSDLKILSEWIRNNRIYDQERLDNLFNLISQVVLDKKFLENKDGKQIFLRLAIYCNQKDHTMKDLIPGLSADVLGDELHYAVELNHLAAIGLLLQAGANPNKVNQRETPFILAIKLNRIEAVEIFLNEYPDIVQKDRDYFPLHLAASKNIEMLRALITTENFNDRDNEGNTLLHMARTKVVVDFLLANKADVNVVNSE